MTEPYELQRTDSWIERVRAADAEAEKCWSKLMVDTNNSPEYDGVTELRALIAIAAELRAQRIARRPGLGKS
jgi:hypothetical protein